jgi:hypothetical protein
MFLRLLKAVVQWLR